MFDGSYTEYTSLKDYDHRMAQLSDPQVTHRRTLAALNAQGQRARTARTLAAAPRPRGRVIVSGVMGVALAVVAGLWAALSTPSFDMLGYVPGIHDTAE